MARSGSARGVGPLVWPKGEPGAPPAPVPPARADWIEAASFAAVAGPEVTRRLGFRVSMRAVMEPPAAAGPETLLVFVEARASVGRLAFGLDRRSIGLALERMFGASDKPGARGQAWLPRLVTGCSSWTAFATLLGEALGEALRDCGFRLEGNPEPTARVSAMSPADPADCQWFALDLGGEGGWLALTRSAEPASSSAEGPVTDRPGEAAPPSPDPGGGARGGSLRSGGSPWRERAVALARGFEFPVGVRIAEIRLPLEQAMRLAVGEILPIDRPRVLMLSVDGVPLRPLERLPASGGDRP